MKNFSASVVFTALFLLFSSLGVAKEMVVQADSMDMRYQQISQEAQRNRELLEIWKGHVRTLTKERDEAYKEIELLKTDASTDAQEPQEPTFLPNENGNAALIQDLSAQIQELKSDNSRLKQIDKELRETKSDKEIILKGKEEALAQVESLKKEIERLQKENTNVSFPVSNANELEKLRNDNRVLEKRFQVLDDTNKLNQARLKDLVKKESQYQKQIQELQTNAGKASPQAAEEIEATKQQMAVFQADLQKANQEKQSLALTIDGLRNENQQIESLKTQLGKTNMQADSAKALGEKQIEGLKTQNANLSQQLAGMKSQMDVLTAQAGKAKALETELASIRQKNEVLMTETESLKKQTDQSQTDKAALGQKLTALESQTQGMQAENQKLKETLVAVQTENEKTISDLSAKSAELQKINQDLKDEMKEIGGRQVKIIEDLRGRLTADLTDMQNFKSNMESYLESLVSGFDERRK